MEKIKCKVKYVGYEYVKAIKDVFSKSGLVSMGVWFVVCVLVSKFGDFKWITYFTILLYIVFILIAYSKAVEYCEGDTTK